jgi:hypothetical protein
MKTVSHALSCFFNTFLLVYATDPPGGNEVRTGGSLARFWGPPEVRGRRGRQCPLVSVP